MTSLCKKESTYQPNHSPPKWWLRNKSHFQTLCRCQTARCQFCHICAYSKVFFCCIPLPEICRYVFNPRMLSTESVGLRFLGWFYHELSNLLQLKLLQALKVLWNRCEKHFFCTLGFSLLTRRRNNEKSESHCARINMDWVLVRPDPKQTLCTCASRPLRTGVWMGRSTGHETMRNARHESRRLRTKEILLTPNHKKRGVKKNQPEPTAISAGYLEGA